MALAPVATKSRNTTTRKSTPKKTIMHELLTPTNPYELLSERIASLDIKIDSTKNELSEQIKSVHTRIDGTEKSLNSRIDSLEKNTNSKFNLILVFMGIGFSSILGLLSVMLSKML